MKSRTRLDSAVFQLTPTRTRYTLVINANGETEKISSGLLDPFLAHLKAAQDQIARGCYSILLEPNHVNDAVWFTKGTVERFVRFVNTPEVLERVNMTESEILQIKEAIAIQNSDALMSNNAENHKQKVVTCKKRSLESTEGSTPLLNADPENTILIYKLGAHYMDSNGSTGRDSSKVQFMRVLETRKTVLQKEQVMAFTRAIAAGFDVDRMVHLISFAECFGAQRLMEACSGFMVLWKQKHETDQTDQLFETEEMPSQSDFSPTNNCITMAPEAKAPGKSKDVLAGFGGKYCKEGNGQPCNAANFVMTLDYNRDKRSSGHQEVCQPMPRLPFHQNHMGGGPFFQPPYSQTADPRFNEIKSVATGRHFMDSKEAHAESEMWETNISCMRPHDASKLEKQISQGQAQRRKAGRNSGKKSGMVLIRNINYISSERRHSITNGESQYSPEPENDNYAENVNDDGPQNKQKKSAGSTKSKASHKRPIATQSPYGKEAASCVPHEVDTGNWQVFQNILLRYNDKDKHATDQGMFTQEKEVQSKRQNKTGGASDELVSCRREVSRGSNDCLVDGGGGYKKAVNDGFVIYGQKTRTDYHVPKLDSFDEGDFVTANRTLYKNSLFNVNDESFLPMCSSTQDRVEVDCRDRNINVDLQSGLQKKEKVASRIRSQLSYEPDEMSFIPMDGGVSQSVGYDPSVDYNVYMQKISKEDSEFDVKEPSKKLDKDLKTRLVHDNQVKRKHGNALRLTPSSEAHVESRPERVRSKAGLEKLKKNKEEEELIRLEALKRERQKRIAARSSSGLAQLTTSSQLRPELKPKISPTLYQGSNIGHLGPGPLSPPQSLPKRTASLGSTPSLKVTSPSLNKAVPAQSTLSSQVRPQLQTKLSPVSYKSSKFSDAEPGPSSPLQRLRRRAASLGSNASEKFTRPSGSNGSSQYASKKPIKSVSSLPELKRYAAVVRPEMRAPAGQIQRLSDPTISNRDHASLRKLHITDPEEPTASAAGVQRVSKPETNNGPVSSSVKKSFSLSSPKATDWSKNQNIPTIFSKGRSKEPATPLERKHQALDHSVYMVQNKTKEYTLPTNGQSSITPEARLIHQSNTKSSQNGTGEDKQVIETTVVLENEMPLSPVMQVSGERIEIGKESDNEHEVGDKTGLSTNHAAVQAPALTVPVNEVEGSNEVHFDEEQNSHKVVADYGVEELPRCSGIDMSPKANQITCAWESSQEDPCTTDLEYIRATPSTPEMATRNVEATKAHASDFTDLNASNKTPGSIFKPRVKVLSKGIRRILRFGRATEKQNAESEGWINKGSLVDNCMASTASSNNISRKKVEQRGFRHGFASHTLYIA